MQICRRTSEVWGPPFTRSGTEGEFFGGIGQGSRRNWLGVVLMDLRIILDEFLRENNRDDGTDFRPELRGPVQPMRATGEVETTGASRKHATTSVQSVGEKRQRRDQSGMGVAATTLAESGRSCGEGGGGIEHVHKMVDET